MFIYFCEYLSYFFIFCAKIDDSNAVAKPEFSDSPGTIFLIKCRHPQIDLHLINKHEAYLYPATDIKTARLFAM